MDFDYDVVIIGSGVAGALTAWRLSTHENHKILVIEAGQNGLDDQQRAQFVQLYQLASNKNVPSPYLQAEGGGHGSVAWSDGTGARDVMNQYYDVAASPDLFKSGFMGLTGGSTWAWRGNTPRFIPNDFRLKSTYGVADDWPLGYADLEPFYVEAEKQLGVSGNTNEWDGLFGAFRSEPFPMPGIVSSHGDKLWKRALSGLVIDGVPVKVITVPQARNSEHYDGRSACQGNSTCIPICPSGAKYDAGVHMKKALANGVTVWEHRAVTRLEADPNGEVHTVHYKDLETADKTEEAVTGKIVVLAGNAIETPRLWLHSRLANKSDQVGRNLMDHPGFELTGLFPEPLYPFRGPQSTLCIESFRDGDFRRAGGAFRMTIGNDGWGRTEPPAAALDHLMWDAGRGRFIRFGKRLQEALADRVTRMGRISYSTEQLPDPSNRVELSDQQDPLGLPRPKVTYRLDDYSKRALAYGFEVARRMWAHLETEGAEEVKPNQPTFEYNGAGHIMGTMRMGSAASNSIVDAEGRTHEHSNVYVVGSSVFVTGSTVNPTVTLAALTIRTADAIAQAMSGAAVTSPTVKSTN
jgi:choline dehydrogenase-like flavoprotein